MMATRLAIAASAALVALFVVACGEEDGSTFDPAPSPIEEEPEGGLPGTFPGTPDTPCVGLACQQVTCENGAKTTVTGTVMAPNGTLPLYNAIVYVPNAALEPFTDGVTCDRCGKVSGKPLVSTLSGVDGKFVLEDVPAGDEIPLVIQIGKWRRQVTLPKVEPCVANPITDVNLTRLPKNRAEGDIPRIAVTTGRCDQLACLLPKLGLDASEFTPNTEPGRLHLYRGSEHSGVAAPAPTGTPNAYQALWDKKESLLRYDMILLSCECGEKNTQKPAAAKTAMYDYTTAGGRVFASHFHYTWAETGPLASTADWHGSASNKETGIDGPFLVDRSFAKGDALARWLVAVGATTTLGEMPISQVRENVGGVYGSTQRWVYDANTGDAQRPEATKYLSVNTPVDKPVEEQCGKFVFADMHLYGLDIQPADENALPNDLFPGSCNPELTPEEKALAFLFFDLASCIQDDTKPPSAPR